MYEDVIFSLVFVRGRKIGDDLKADVNNECH